MEHIFPPKSIVLVANVQGTINWTAPDISERFAESIIKRPVAIRFSCSTTTANSVYCGVRYSTLTKDYLVAERKTLFFIPASGTTEVTPASKPALGLLNAGIISFSLDLIAPVAGAVTVSLIVDDEPPTLSSDPGELIGLDSKFAVDYLLVNQGTDIAPPVGTNTYLSYTVPAGKRFILDTATITLQPTPSFPSLIRITLTAIIAAVSYPVLSVDSFDNEPVNALFASTFDLLLAGDTIRFDVINNDTTAGIGAKMGYIGREIF